MPTSARACAAARARSRAGASRCPASTTRSTRWRPSRRRARPASTTTSSARPWPASPASSGASSSPARGTASPIYDDYGHHPVEIAAVLKAARAGARGRVIAVVEPHRYTRVRDLFHEFAACFKDADSVIVTPLYSAGELPIDGIDHASLAEAIRAHRPRRRRRRSTASARSPRRSSASRRPATWSSASAPATAPNGRTRCPHWLAGEPLRAGGAA